MEHDASIARLDPQEVERIRSQPGVQVIDVRLPFDYFGGRVPGSMNMPGSSLTSSTGLVPFDRKIVLVCDDGEASLEAGRAIAAAGYSDVALLEGGMDAWIEADLPMETISDGIPAAQVQQVETKN